LKNKIQTVVSTPEVMQLQVGSRFQKPLKVESKTEYGHCTRRGVAGQQFCRSVPIKSKQVRMHLPLAGSFTEKT
jgi:hypothetical protein